MSYLIFKNEHREIIDLLPVNCRFWRIKSLQETYQQRFVKVKEYNTRLHQIDDYYKIIFPIKLV